VIPEIKCGKIYKIKDNDKSKTNFEGIWEVYKSNTKSLNRRGLRIKPVGWRGDNGSFNAEWVFGQDITVEEW
jgi:hypothetical protein